MPAKKYLSSTAPGGFAEVAGTVTSAGAADDGKIVSLDATGRLDNSVMPSGIGADTQAIVASEALAAGDFVNIWSNVGVFNVRKADGSTSGKEADGYVLSAFASAATATIYMRGTNTQVASMTPGDVYLSATTAGRATATAPVAAGQVAQRIGSATSATSINFTRGPAVLKA